jgi:hypothetical protein
MMMPLEGSMGMRQMLRKKAEAEGRSGNSSPMLTVVTLHVEIQMNRLNQLNTWGEPAVLRFRV